MKMISPIDAVRYLFKWFSHIIVVIIFALLIVVFGVLVCLTVFIAIILGCIQGIVEETMT